MCERTAMPCMQNMKELVAFWVREREKKNCLCKKKKKKKFYVVLVLFSQLLFSAEREKEEKGQPRQWKQLTITFFLLSNLFFFFWSNFFLSFGGPYTRLAPPDDLGAKKSLKNQKKRKKYFKLLFWIKLWLCSQHSMQKVLSLTMWFGERCCGVEMEQKCFRDFVSSN